jgi:putative membrane protein
VNADDRRYPRRVYREGDEPDPRFTLANERTFLAWIRTALALIAAGVAVETLIGDAGGAGRTLLAVALIGLGTVCGALAFGRWMGTERALRTGRPLPAPVLAPVLGYGIAAVGVLACVLLVLWR